MTAPPPRRGRHRPLALVLLSLLTAVGTGCAANPDACVTAHNDRCEELAGCALGTDSTDCDTACSGPWTPDIVAACAHDGAGTGEPDEPPERGTEGSGGIRGLWDGTTTVRGAAEDSLVDRHFRVYVPSGYEPAEPSPLLFVLGGFRVDGYYLSEYTELERTAELNNTVLVYMQPEWRDFGGNAGWVFAWYVYKGAWEGGWSDNPDLAFLAEVRDVLGTLYNIDRTRTFVSGHSRGGALSVIATFERPDLFAGFCSQAGFIDATNSDKDYIHKLTGLSNPPHRAGVLVHGDADADVQIGASDRIRDELDDIGWDSDEDYLYLRLEDVPHQWQPQYNEEFLRFLIERPLHLGEAAP